MTPSIAQRLGDRASWPMVMGVLNVTPDSFSDAGEYLDPHLAVDRAIEMIAEGAEIIDVGPESTRPGSGEVSTEEQIRRAVPVVEGIRARDSTVVISIDSRLTSVVKAALDAGANMVNDTSALRDDADLVHLVAATKAPVVLMHRKGTPATMQSGGGPYYDDVIGEIAAFLGERITFAVAQGIDRRRIIIDPGLGFGKRLEHNLLILRQLDRFVSLGQPVLIGASRKSFVGQVLANVRPRGRNDARDREAGSLACATIAALAGAAIVRVHDVRATVEAVCLAARIRGA